MAPRFRGSVGVVATVVTWSLAAGIGLTLPTVTKDHRSWGSVEILQPSSAFIDEPLTDDRDAYGHDLALSTDDLGEEIAAPAYRIRTCQLPNTLITDLDGDLSVAVSLVGEDATEGTALFGIDEDEPVAPASVVKLFTAVAALETLGPDFRFRTRVVAGDVPGDIWLVGGGDVTLTRAPGADYYDSEAHLEELAATTVAGLAAGSSGAEQGRDAGIERVWVDDSRYDRFASWDESWRPGSAGLGYIAPVSALQVDGDRDNPAVRLSPRSTDPRSRAAAWFGDALWRSGGGSPEMSFDAIAPDGRLLAEVASARLPQLLRIMLVDSDNSLAEVISREVALSLDPRGELGLTPGEAVLEAVRAVFRGSEVVPYDTLREAVIHDGSGLSPLSAISSEGVLSLLQVIERSPKLEQVRLGLPVSGESGSLRNRYQPVASDLQGLVQAKTGSIRGTRSLAGYLESPEGDRSSGDQLAFSIVLSGNQVSNASRNDIDRLVGALAECGENLADWTDSDN